MDRQIASNILALFIIVAQSSRYHHISFLHDDLVKLGTKLISIFKDQRTRPSMRNKISHHQQFSVVYLASSEEGVLKFPDDEVLKFPDDEKLTMTDNRKAVHYPSNFSFITARVHNGKHAEQLMMKKFEQLKNDYKEPVKFIVLYSWLLPCEGCCNNIISTIHECFPKKLPGTLLLYSRVRRKELKCKEDIKNLFRSKGIYMKHVKSENV